MIISQTNLFGVLSELFVNLSAGWFGYVFIESNRFPATFAELTLRVTLGMLSLAIAYQLRNAQSNL